MHISLSYFPDQNREPDIGSAGTKGDITKNSIIEGKLVNQLLYQIDSRSIPQTNFRVKNNINKLNVTLLSIWISIFLLFLICLVDYSNWQKFILQGTFKKEFWTTLANFSTSSSVVFLVFLIVILSAMRFIYFIFYAQVSQKI
nr:hypothetical protein [Leuconostoc mesenteroides]